MAGVDVVFGTRRTDQPAKSRDEETNRMLVESESRLKKFLEAMPVGVMVYDAFQKLNFINQRARTLA